MSQLALCVVNLCLHVFLIMYSSLLQIYRLNLTYILSNLHSRIPDLLLGNVEHYTFIHLKEI